MKIGRLRITIRVISLFFDVSDGILYWTNWFGFFTLGSSLFVLKTLQPVRTNVILSIVLSILMLLTVNEILGIIGTIAAAILIILFVFLSNNLFDIKVMGSEPFVFVGSASFSWYLVHQNIGYSIHYYFLPKGDISLLYLFIPLSITFILALMIDRIVSYLPKKIV